MKAKKKAPHQISNRFQYTPSLPLFFFPFTLSQSSKGYATHVQGIAILIALTLHRTSRTLFFFIEIVTT